jgi:hypothetical protein
MGQSNVLDVLAKLWRCLSREGVTIKQILVAMRPKNVKNLARYLRAGCPERSRRRPSEVGKLFDGLEEVAVGNLIRSIKPPDVR